ncbi:uncharacterized protein LOC133304506 isoform X1 [Gastrolobium bilobum]|uniref:uncharacterized protein LOC133304506 isoform X1 n=1 Tax=Gastrolobium bilobum TaxID=150636 RepID=UPI002AB064D9|nr:uncharacterized protein LOC133304506 isoform X1 [Gastrolobium bilobum]
MATPRRMVYMKTASSYVVQFLQRPHSLPLVLSMFVLVTWISLRMHVTRPSFPTNSTTKDDIKANVVRFHSRTPVIAKDNRGWLLHPLSLASASHISGGAVTCASIHVGEIRPGMLRGNHRHLDCNETLVIWGAATKFRLENNEVPDNGYAEVIIGSDDVAVATSPSGIAHALVNIDQIRSTFFIGCQDSIINYNASSTDFNVWKDL